MATRQGTWRPTVAMEQADGLVVLIVTGRLGEKGASSPTLRAALTEGLSASRGLIVDLSRVDYLSSPGITLLEDLVEQASALGCPLALCGVTDAARIALDLAEVTARLPRAATRQEAVTVLLSAEG